MGISNTENPKTGVEIRSIATVVVKNYSGVYTLGIDGIYTFRESNGETQKDTDETYLEVNKEYNVYENNKIYIKNGKILEILDSHGRDIGGGKRRRTITKNNRKKRKNKSKRTKRRKYKN
jgi:hypothetical protein